MGQQLAESNIIKDTLREELDRNIRAQEAYQSEIASLPKGSVAIKTRSNHRYCYLKHRVGNRVVTDYVGRAAQVESSLRQQVEHRKQLELTLKRLKQEQCFIEKALRHK